MFSDEDPEVLHRLIQDAALRKAKPNKKGHRIELWLNDEDWRLLNGLAYREGCTTRTDALRRCTRAMSN